MKMTQKRTFARTLTASAGIAALFAVAGCTRSGDLQQPGSTGDSTSVMDTGSGATGTSGVNQPGTAASHRPSDPSSVNQPGTSGVGTPSDPNAPTTGDTSNGMGTSNTGTGTGGTGTGSTTSGSGAGPNGG